MDFNVTLVSLLVIVLLFIPGFFFKRFYYTGKFTKQFTSGIFAERFITSVFWGIIVQMIVIIVSSKLLNPDYDSIKSPISKFYTDLMANKIPDCSIQNIYYASGYIVTTIIVAILMGYISHKVVRILRLDRKFPVLRFANYWNYYFKGDLITTHGTQSRKGTVISTYIDVVVDDGSDTNRLYSGFLTDYTISTTSGELETIAITDAHRWSRSKNAFTKINGDCFIVPYNKVLNFNLRYNVKANVVPDVTLLVALISILLLPTLLIYIPYQFYYKIGLMKTILGTALVASLWFFVFTLIFGVFVNKTTPEILSKPSDRRKFAMSLIGMVVLLSWLTYIVLSQ